MDLNELKWRLETARASLDLPNVLDAARIAPEIDRLIRYGHTYADATALTGADAFATTMTAFSDAARLRYEEMSGIADSETLRAMDAMLSVRAEVEAIKPAVDLRHLTGLHPSGLADLMMAAQRPLELEQAVRQAALASQTFGTFYRDTSVLDRVLEALRQNLTVIGGFRLQDLVRSDRALRAEDEGPDLIMPEEARRRLLQVEFWPVRVIQEIRQRPEMMRKLSPREFEEMTAELLNGLGFENVILTPRSGDGGRDVVAVRRVKGIPLLFAFECKRYAEGRRVQLATLRALLGTVSHARTKANIGVLVTTSRFSRGAREFILSEALIDGKDFADLVRWLRQYRPR